MPCSDSSSGLNIRLDIQEGFLSFEFAKITCSGEISAQTGLSLFCRGKTLPEILDLDFSMLVSALNLNNDQEKQFILYLELEALKAGIAQYLGIDHPAFDPERCRITSIEHTNDYIEIAQVILPPKELPKIISCAKSTPAP
ncbi:MAG: hypothetical protein HY209_06675 [Candidatus Omnitrophica bacterium]|nr:hypothetical protein [Candidatus Omnitrophota bacterium]